MESYNEILKKYKELQEEHSKIIKEFTEFRNESDEMNKEYEETIEVLSTSTDMYKEENEELQSKLLLLINENKQLKIDQEELRDKNKDKMKDIQLLNNKMEQLQSKFDFANSTESSLKQKLISLENDNEHYLSQIRQFQAQVEELKEKLESNIEELVSTQADFDEYKAEKEEELERMRERLKEEIEGRKVIAGKIGVGMKEVKDTSQSGFKSKDIGLIRDISGETIKEVNEENENEVCENNKEGGNVEEKNINYNTKENEDITDNDIVDAIEPEIKIPRRGTTIRPGQRNKLKELNRSMNKNGEKKSLKDSTCLISSFNSKDLFGPDFLDDIPNTRVNRAKSFIGQNPMQSLLNKIAS